MGSPQPGWISGGDKPKEPRFNDPKRGKRLQTIMADAGVASRRACETLIEEGAVEVSGPSSGPCRFCRSRQGPHLGQRRTHPP